MEIINFDPTAYGIEESKAKQISQMFRPMLDKMEELENEYNEIVSLEINNETIKKASDLLNKYVKVRTGTAKIHKEMKAFYLAGGRFVDGWKNAQLAASQGKEEKLMAIKKHFENLEKERIAKLQEERAKLLEPYDLAVVPGNLGDVEPDVWENYLKGVKSNYETRIAAEKKAEEDRLAAEKKQAEEQERIRKENQAIKERNELQASRLNELLPYNPTGSDVNMSALHELSEAEYQTILIEKKAKHDKAEAERKIEEERNKKIQRELAAKREEEEKKAEEEKAKAETEANKDDADRMRDLINDLMEIGFKYSFKSNRYRAIMATIRKMIGNVISSINSELEK